MQMAGIFVNDKHPRSDWLYACVTPVGTKETNNGFVVPSFFDTVFEQIRALLQGMVLKK